MKIDFKRFRSDPEYRAQLEKREDYQAFVAEEVQITRGELFELVLKLEADYSTAWERAINPALREMLKESDGLEQERDTAKRTSADATSSQSGTDRALTKALEKIKVLERTPEERLERMIKQYPTHEQELRRFFKRWGAVPAYFNPYGGPHEDPDDLQSIELEYAEQEIADIGQERDNARQTSKSATSAQGGTDRKLTEAQRENAKLKAVIKTFTEHDIDAIRQLLIRHKQGDNLTSDERERIMSWELSPELEAEIDRKSATSAQGGTDRKLGKAEQRIAELEAKLKATEAERDAALKARDEMLKLYADQHGK